MVENVALGVFVGGPRGAGGKAVQLQRHALGGGRQRPHHQRHVLVDARVRLQVGRNVGAQRANVGQPALVGQQLHALAQHCARLGVGVLHRAALFLHVVLQQLEPGKVRHLLRVQKADGAGIDLQRALDAPPARLAHAAPVAVALAHQAPGGDGGDGLVKVLHLHGVQRNVDHVAVSAHLRHLYPVAQAQHVVGRQLHAGGERQDGVLEHQHQHRRHGAQARQHDQGRAVHQHRCGHDGAGQHQHQLAQLHIALDGAHLVRRRLVALFQAVLLLLHQQRVEHGHQRTHQLDGNEGRGHVRHHGGKGGVQVRHMRHAGLQHQPRQEPPQVVEHVVVEHDFRDPGAGLQPQPPQRGRERPDGQQAHRKGGQQQAGQADGGLHPGFQLGQKGEGCKGIHGQKKVLSVNRRGGERKRRRHKAQADSANRRWRPGTSAAVPAKGGAAAHPPRRAAKSKRLTANGKWQMARCPGQAACSARALYEAHCGAKFQPAARQRLCLGPLPPAGRLRTAVVFAIKKGAFSAYCACAGGSFYQRMVRLPGKAVGAACTTVRHCRWRLPTHAAKG